MKTLNQSNVLSALMDPASAGLKKTISASASVVIDEDVEEKDKLTFPQIWVESVVESSGDEDDEDYERSIGNNSKIKAMKLKAVSVATLASPEEEDAAPRSHNGKVSVAKALNDNRINGRRQRVLRSLLRASSADISFDRGSSALSSSSTSSLLSPGSSRQSSFCQYLSDSFSKEEDEDFSTLLDDFHQHQQRFHQEQQGQILGGSAIEERNYDLRRPSLNVEGHGGDETLRCCWPSSATAEKELLGEKASSALSPRDESTDDDAGDEEVEIKCERRLTAAAVNIQYETQQEQLVEEEDDVGNNRNNDGLIRLGEYNLGIPLTTEVGEGKGEGRQTGKEEEERKEEEDCSSRPFTSLPPVESLNNNNNEDERIRRGDKIAAWLDSVEKHGFAPEFLWKSCREGKVDDEDEGEAEEEDDETWFEEGVTRIFDTYYDITKDEVDRVTEGKIDPKTGQPTGKATLKLKNGDELMGTFKPGYVRQGRGSVEGETLLKHGILCIRGFYKDSVLTGEGRANVDGGGMWPSVKQRILFEGVFNDGYLEGPVRAIDESDGNLVFAGRYERGLPSGPCWLRREGQGWIYGDVNPADGRFTGTNIAYVYPDLSTCLHGEFANETLVSATAKEVADADLDESGIMCLKLRDNPGRIVYERTVSTIDKITCPWMTADPYESETVVCRQSQVPHAGDGLFARTDLPAERIVSYYNGLIVPGPDPQTGREPLYASSSAGNYQIYVDWRHTDNSPYVDVPLEATDFARYSASLAHKANHSFAPNCVYVTADHPRFGRIPALKTLREISAGEELFSHYKYDMVLAPSWYQEAWETFSLEGNLSSSA